MSGYRVKEIFLTIQGEGINAGRVALFIRFSGCNLWNGREEDRGCGRGGCSAWCDTDFRGIDGPLGGRYESHEDLAAMAWSLWPQAGGKPLVIVTGGEPVLQLDPPLIQALHKVGFEEVAIETNGTLPVPDGLDWVAVSPKAGAPLVATKGDELKLVYPQVGISPEQFEHLDFDAFILQPRDGPEVQENTRKAIEFCLNNPHWRFGLQMHKVLNLK